MAGPRFPYNKSWQYCKYRKICKFRGPLQLPVSHSRYKTKYLIQLQSELTLILLGLGCFGWNLKVLYGGRCNRQGLLNPRLRANQENLAALWGPPVSSVPKSWGREQSRDADKGEGNVHTSLPSHIIWKVMIGSIQTPKRLGLTGEINTKQECNVRGWG